MMFLEEFGGNKDDPPDELIHKKLAYIQGHMAMNNKHIAIARLNPKSPSYDQDMTFYMNVFCRLQTEKAETLSAIGHHCFGDCRCIYCVRVINPQ